METSKKIFLSVLIALAFTVGIVGIMQGRQADRTLDKVLDVAKPRPVQTDKLGTADQFPQFTTNAQFTIGKGFATRVAPSNPGRTYLEIGNFSGATSTAQAIYCTASNQTNIATTTSSSIFTFPAGNPTYAGFAIQASSSKVFSRVTGVPTGAIYCVNPLASSTVSTVDF